MGPAPFLAYYFFKTIHGSLGLWVSVGIISFNGCNCILVCTRERRSSLLSSTSLGRSNPIHYVEPDPLSFLFPPMRTKVRDDNVATISLVSTLIVGAANLKNQ
jgi:hypothetical protein